MKDFEPSKRAALLLGPKTGTLAATNESANRRRAAPRSDDHQSDRLFRTKSHHGVMIALIELHRLHASLRGDPGVPGAQYNVPVDAPTPTSNTTRARDRPRPRRARSSSPRSRAPPRPWTRTRRRSPVRASPRVPARALSSPARPLASVPRDFPRGSSPPLARTPRAHRSSSNTTPSFASPSSLSRARRSLRGPRRARARRARRGRAFTFYHSPPLSDYRYTRS